MSNYCSECGFFMWSDLSREAGHHLECGDDGYEEPADAVDLEDRLEAAFGGEE